MSLPDLPDLDYPAHFVPDEAMDEIARLKASYVELLDSLKEMRKAFTGSIRVLDKLGTAATQAFCDEMNRIGVKPDVRKRADDLIAKNEVTKAAGS